MDIHPRGGEGLHLPRRLFHMAAGSLPPLAVLVLPWPVAVALVGAGATVLAVGEAVRLHSPRVNAWLLRWLGLLFRPQEARRVTGATWLALSATVCLLLFPPGVAALALLMTAWGDPLAGLAGGRWGRRRVGRKSGEGALAFLTVAVGLALLFHALGLASPLPLLLAGAGVAVVVELLPLPLDDNLTVPLTSGGLMALLGAG